MQTNLRKVGGSVMLAVSPAFLKELKIAPGSAVDVALQEGQLVVRPISKPKYELADLLAKCDPKIKRSKEDQEWLDIPSVGNEI
jgi:antitoxin ChpS